MQDPRHARPGLATTRLTIEKLWRAGADVFRINMSHADPQAMRERVAMIRAVEERVGRPIGILVDLQGPKLRVGLSSAAARDLVKGAEFHLRFRCRRRATRPASACPIPKFCCALAPGHNLLIDDGKLRLHVIEAARRRAPWRRSKSAGASPTARASACPTPKCRRRPDRQGPRSISRPAVETGVDWVALSFVQRADDVAGGQALAGGRALVMAKIEKPQAIARLDEIMLAADAFDGRARRSRRRNAARKRARPAKAHHPRGAAGSAARW